MFPRGYPPDLRCERRRRRMWRRRSEGEECEEK